MILPLVVWLVGSAITLLWGLHASRWARRRFGVGASAAVWSFAIGQTAVLGWAASTHDATNVPGWQVGVVVASGVWSFVLAPIGLAAAGVGWALGRVRARAGARGG